MAWWKYGTHRTSLHNILLPNLFNSIMPHVLQPGGLSQNMCVCYTACRKLGLFALVKRIMEEEGVTLRQAAEQLNVSHSLLVKWRLQRAAEVDPIMAMLNSKRKAKDAGPLGQLKPLEQALPRHIFEHRDQDTAVHTFNLVYKALSLVSNTRYHTSRRIQWQGRAKWESSERSFQGGVI